MAAARRHPLRAALVLPALALLYVLALVPFTPGIGDLRKAKSETPSVVMSSDGIVLAEYKRVNRQWVPLEKIAPSVVEALIAMEDHRFYQHHGIDLRRTAGAIFSTLSGDTQGGSTITQQLARNLYPEEIGRSVTLTRKIKEAITALKIETLYSKAEILETYLNTVPFLYNAFGIEMAARLAHVVKLLLRKIAAAHPRQYKTIARVQRQKAGLQHGALLAWPAPSVCQRLQLRQLPGHGPVGGLLQPGIDGGAQHQPVGMDVVVALIRPGDQPFAQLLGDVGRRPGRLDLPLEI